MTDLFRPDGFDDGKIVQHDAPFLSETRYTARVRHWTVADRETHEKMDFHQGRRQCTDQLAALVATL